MNTTTQRFLVCLACAGIGTVASAQSFMGLGDLAGGDYSSHPRNLSGDGRFVTGSSVAATTQQAFIWSEQTGMVGLGVPAGSDSVEGFAVSNDGGRVIGFHAEQSVSFSAEVFEWTSSGGIGVFDPFPANAVDRIAVDLSADGSTVVGAYRSAPFEPVIVYRWDSGTLTEIVPSGFAGAVSADGSVVVGNVFQNPNGPPPFIKEAFLWTVDDGLTMLGYLPGGSGNSGATGVSADGTVVVGQSANAPGDSEAFRWTESGGMVGLGDLPGGDFASSATDTTADGSIVVGTSNVASAAPPIVPDNDPFIWDATHGMRNLVDVLTDDYGLGAELAGWNLNSATAISDDGKVIVGNDINPDGNLEAWRAVLVPEPSAVLLSAFACMGLLTFSRRRG